MSRPPGIPFPLTWPLRSWQGQKGCLSQLWFPFWAYTKDTQQRVLCDSLCMVQTVRCSRVSLLSKWHFKPEVGPGMLNWDLACTNIYIYMYILYMCAEILSSWLAMGFSLFTILFGKIKPVMSSTIKICLLLLLSISVISNDVIQAFYSTELRSSEGCKI